jgi:hypothetical protein
MEEKTIQVPAEGPDAADGAKDAKDGATKDAKAAGDAAADKKGAAGDEEAAAGGEAKGAEAQGEGGGKKEEGDKKAGDKKEDSKPKTVTKKILVPRTKTFHVGLKVDLMFDRWTRCRRGQTGWELRGRGSASVGDGRVGADQRAVNIPLRRRRQWGGAAPSKPSIAARRCPPRD